MPADRNSRAAQPRGRKAPPPLRHDTALFLDADGTLLDIAPTPDAVAVADGLIETLRRLNRALDGAVAIVSGRRGADLERYFGAAGVVWIGEHGAAASISLPKRATRPRQRVPPAVTAALRRFQARHPKSLLEEKSHGVALHVRAVPEAAPAAQRLATGLARAHDGDVRLIRGKAVFEFVAAGTSKGRAIEMLLARAPFRGRRPCVLGDDVTDEDGFAAANALGGTSVRVGPRPASGRTAARFALKNPAAVRRWLGQAADALLARPRPRASSPKAR